MRRALPCFLIFLLAGGVFSVARSLQTQDTSKDAPASDAPIPAEAVKRENPVKASPDGLAKAKRLFATQCAMCHGASGDGKGELAGSMGLTLRDWRDPAALEKMTDGELFYILSKGRGKMIGEEDRFPVTMRWELVNYMRSLAKKVAGSGEKPSAETPQP